MQRGESEFVVGGLEGVMVSSGSWQESGSDFDVDIDVDDVDFRDEHERERELTIAEVRASLAENPPRLPSRLLCHHVGRALFERLAELPSTHPAQTERDLLRAKAADIVVSAQGNVDDVIDLSPISVPQVAPLIQQVLFKGRRVRPRYIAVDLCACGLQRTRAELSEAFPRLETVGLFAGSSQQDSLSLLPSRRSDGNRLVLLLGNKIGASTLSDAEELLTRVRSHLNAGDALLVGTQLAADPWEIQSSYNDPQGVTSAFNRNILSAVNSLTDSRFDLDGFEHVAAWVPARRRMEMWLKARRKMSIDLGGMGGVFTLAMGEGICTEVSRCFEPIELLHLLGQSGFAIEGVFPSENKRSVLLLAIAHDLH